MTTCIYVAALDKAREIELDSGTQALCVGHANLALVVHLSLRIKQDVAAT